MLLLKRPNDDGLKWLWNRGGDCTVKQFGFIFDSRHLVHTHGHAVGGRDRLECRLCEFAAAARPSHCIVFNGDEWNAHCDAIVQQSM